MDGAACPFIEGTTQGFVFLHLPDNGRTAAVCPGLHVHEGLSAFIEAGKTVHDRTQGDACQFFVLITQLSRRLTDDFLDGFENLERAFFSPVRMRCQQRIKGFRRADVGPVFRISNGPDPGRADVDADPYFLVRRIHRRNDIHESYSLSRSLVRNLFDDFMIPFPLTKCNKNIILNFIF